MTRPTPERDRAGELEQALEALDDLRLPDIDDNAFDDDDLEQGEHMQTRKYGTLVVQPSNPIRLEYPAQVLAIALVTPASPTAAERADHTTTVQLTVDGLDCFLHPVPLFCLPPAEFLRMAAARQNPRELGDLAIEPIMIKPGAPIVVEADRPAMLLLLYLVDDVEPRVDELQRAARACSSTVGLAPIRELAGRYPGFDPAWWRELELELELEELTPAIVERGIAAAREAREAERELEGLDDGDGDELEGLDDGDELEQSEPTDAELVDAHKRPRVTLATLRAQVMTPAENLELARRMIERIDRDKLPTSGPRYLEALEQETERIAPAQVRVDRMRDHYLGRDRPGAMLDTMAVQYGDDVDRKPGTVRIVERNHETALETWELVDEQGRALGSFSCYDDRRRQWSERGAAIGHVDGAGAVWVAR